MYVRYAYTCAVSYADCIVRGVSIGVLFRLALVRCWFGVGFSLHEGVWV